MAARPRANASTLRDLHHIVILKKTLLSTHGCSTRVPGLVNFGLQTPDIDAWYYKICLNLRIVVYISGIAETFTRDRW